MPPAPMPARAGVDGVGWVVKRGGVGMSEQEGRAQGVQAAQIAINAMWAKGAAMIGIPFIISLVGIVLGQALATSRLEAAVGQVQTDVRALQTPPQQVREEERRWAQILGDINGRLGRIEVQLQILQIQSSSAQRP